MSSINEEDKEIGVDGADIEAESQITVNKDIKQAEEAAKEKAEEPATGAAPKKEKGDASGKGKRLRHGALSVVFTVFFVAAVVLINIIFNMVLDRFDLAADLSDNSLYTIDSTTSDYLKGIGGDISIIIAADETSFENAVLPTSGQQYGKQVSEIIKSFAGANSGISYQYKDLESNPGFYSQYGPTLQSGNIIVESGKTGRNVILTSSDYLAPEYYYYDAYGTPTETDYSTFYMYAQMGMPVSIEYYAAAEKCLLSAIMNVTNENPVNVAVLEDDYGAARPEALITLLEANAYIVESFKLSTVESIDSKYDYVIIYAPIYDLENDDIDKLDRWLDNGGKYGKNLFYAASATTEALPRLNQYLQEWGISLNSGYVYQNNSQYKYEVRPTYQELSLNESDYSEGVDTSTQKTYGDAMHPITLLFDEYSNYYTQAIMSSYSGAVIMPFDANLGEFDPSSAEETGEFVVAAEAQKTRFEGTDPYSSRIFVAGGHLMLHSSFLQADQVNNADVFLNMFNKTSGREAVELSITPKSYSVPTFEITSGQAKGITIAFSAVVPLVIAACGIVVIVRRKRR